MPQCESRRTGGTLVHVLQVLAVDVSIWLTQFIKAMRDDDGKVIKNAHLIGTFRRIVKVRGGRSWEEVGWGEGHGIVTTAPPYPSHSCSSIRSSLSLSSMAVRRP
jgi:hypothetical protein